MEKDSSTINMETNLYKGNLKKEDKLGKGSFGVVFKGHKQNRNKTPVAIKRIENDDDCFSENAIKDFQALLAVSGHVNIVELLGLHEEEDFIYIIMEYCDGDLEKFLSQGVPSYTVKLDIMKQCTAGISYIHGLSPPVIHRDIKPSNILFQESPSGLIVKIGDFGLAKVFLNITSRISRMYMATAVGSVAFRAPELFLSSSDLHYTAMIDNYALGLVFAVLVNYTEEDKSLEPHTVGVAREPYLSFGQRQLQEHNENRPPPSLYFHPQIAANHPRMKSLIVNLTSLDAKKRAQIQTVESEINKEISQQCEGASGSTSASTVSHPVSGARPKRKTKTSEASPAEPVKVRKPPTVGTSASSTVSHVGSYRMTDRRLSSIKQITPAKEGSFTITNRCPRFCHYKDILFFPCADDNCIDCYSIQGGFMRSIDLSTYGVRSPRSVHPLTGDSLLVAARSGLYEVGTGEGGECRCVLQGWCRDVHVSEGVVAVLVKESECDKVHILRASDLSSPGHTIKLTHSQAYTVLLHQDSLCVSSGDWAAEHTHISVYSLSTGELTSQYGQRGWVAAGELRWPLLSACDAEGCLLVVDPNNHPLQTLSAQGEWAVLPGLGEVRGPRDAVIVGEHMLVLDDKYVHAYKIAYK